MAPPTVAETKRKFVEAYPKPIAAVYSTVLQELLVQQHFIRYSSLYQYNKASGVGRAKGSVLAAPCLARQGRPLSS